jgi:hypothetical protein
MTAATTIPRKPGVEVVRRELDNEHANAGIHLLALATDRVLEDARRLYEARREVAVHLAPWPDACANTVREWVAVAREARRMHGGGR